MDRMIQIQLAADPIDGPARAVLEDVTLSDGERIELLLGILVNIWEVTNDYETQRPTLGVSRLRKDSNDLGAALDHGDVDGSSRAYRGSGSDA